ncbi:hypothetical protein BGX28_007326 [Mortierella sp. GBA30]|nr:hypothetical protein BGX28_007326 [Mortierella sp. GBA30]
MNLQSPFSLSTFPIGLGLTAAAHVHLCKRSMSRTEKQREHYLLHHHVSQLDMLSQSLEDLNALTEMIELLNIVLDRFPGNRTRRVPKRRQDSRRSRNQHRHQTKPSARGPNSTEHNNNNTKNNATTIDYSYAENSTSGSSRSGGGKKVKWETTLGEDTHPLDDQGGIATCEHHGDEDTSRCTRSKTQHRRRSKKSSAVVEIPVEELEEWSETYKALRMTQERCNGRTYEQLRRVMPSSFYLKNELLFSSLLSSATMLRYLFSTERFWSYFAKYLSRLRGLGSWIPTQWRSWSPPTSSYIPWGLAPNNSQATSTAIATTGHGIVDLLASAVTTTASDNAEAKHSSSASVAFAFLPLVPTLFVSGIHFMVAARTQWTLQGMQRDLRRKKQFIKRLEVLSAFLMIREKRLKWLADEVRAFDNEQEEEEARWQHDVVNEDSTTANVMASGWSSSSSSSPSRPRTSAAIPPTLLAHSSNSRIYSLFQGRNNGDHQVSQVQDDNNNSNNQQQQQQGTRQRRNHQAGDPKFYTFGPDLENMDLDLFLRNARERSRILRLEFEAMHQELTLFRELLLPLNPLES